MRGTRARGTTGPHASCKPPGRGEGARRAGRAATSGPERGAAGCWVTRVPSAGHPPQSHPSSLQVPSLLRRPQGGRRGGGVVPGTCGRWGTAASLVPCRPPPSSSARPSPPSSRAGVGVGTPSLATSRFGNWTENYAGDRNNSFFEPGRGRGSPNTGTEPALRRGPEGAAGVGLSPAAQRSRDLASAAKRLVQFQNLEGSGLPARSCLGRRGSRGGAVTERPQRSRGRQQRRHAEQFLVTKKRPQRPPGTMCPSSGRPTGHAGKSRGQQAPGTQ